MSKIDKFTYLKSLLKPSAQSAIQGLSVSEDGYDAAIDILENRYGKKEMLIRSHINKLLNLQPVRNLSSLKELRNLYDSCEIHIRSLKSLGIELESYGNLLFPILTKLLPDSLMLNYNRENKNETESWNVLKLLEYLRTEIETRERTLSFRRKEYDDNTRFDSKAFNKKEVFEKDFVNNKSFRHKMPTATTLNANVENKCLFCSENHDTESCFKTIEEKKNILKSQARCFLCFKRFHLVKNCKSSIRCKFCSRRHNILICEENENKREKTDAIVSSIQNENVTQDIYLQTATALAIGKGHKSKLRLLYDLGSQRSFILSSVAEKLSLQVVGEENVTIHAFGSKTAVSQKRKRYRIVLKNPEMWNRGTTIEVLETPDISEAVLAVPEKGIRNYLHRNKLQLADRTYGDSKYFRLSILIGSDYYWKMVTGKVRRLSDDLVLSETILGWTVNGSTAPIDSNIMQQTSISVMKVGSEQVKFDMYDEVNATLKSFWDLETMGIKPEKEQSEIEDTVLENFNESVKFNNNMYEVRLPWNERAVELKDNFELARKRLSNLSKKFEKRPEFYEKYAGVVHSYLEKGMAEIVNSEPNSVSYYMPHQAVIREEKITTKFRVVFDASSHSAESISLNDCLHAGPNLNPDILSVLLRFRLHKIAVTGDIEQAFLQISLNPMDRDAVRFLWIENPSNTGPELKFKILRMTRVLFGAKPSCFLLSATIKHHINKYKSTFPETFDHLNECMYVDDLLVGVDDESQGLKLYTEVKSILKDANFNMRKWTTNSRSLQSQFDLKEENLHQESGYSKVLGYKWNREEDCLKVELQNLSKYDDRNQRVTKREVLKIIGKLYDPIGILNPFTITARILMQEIWKVGLNWEDELSEDMRNKWANWCRQFSSIEDLKIARHYFGKHSKNALQDLQLHCFNDASAKAYGSVIYVRYRANEQIFTVFIISKVRVAPIKKLSLPRLELMSAVIGTRLTAYVKEHLFKEAKISLHFWTDSMIVLHWIRGDAHEWKPFVQNRIREIQQNSDPNVWSHCPGSENPADLLTRGEKAELFFKNELWFKGPKWLQEDEILWPQGMKEANIKPVEVEKRSSKGTKILQASCLIHEENPIFKIEDHSELNKVLRITSWIFRFVNNMKKCTIKISGLLTTEEMLRAEKYWIKRTQEEYFPEEMKALLKKILVPRNSKILNLNPFLDEDEIMRLRGRLQNSDLSYSEAHPIILPSKSHYTNLQIRKAHEQLAHSGVAETLIQLREKFWIIRGRQQVKRMLRRCVICRKFSGKPYSQDISPLPPDRVKEALPFEVSGVDFLGPLYLQNRTKIYIALFTCAVVRAVHLEIVMNLTTAEFLMAFRRFISRRGICKIIYSDNAKTFKKVDKDLQQIWNLIRNPEVQNYFSNQRIEWKFIVERAAWWGGFYERLVRSTKVCLKKILGKSSLEYKEFETTLHEVEAILNSRPLTFVSTDASEPSPLCPAHFLVGKRLTALPPEKIRITSSTKSELTRKYRYRLNLVQQFWKKWKQLYLMDLKSAHQSESTNSMQVAEGVVVQIKEDNQPRLLWKLGIVTQTHPGRDGKIRACSLRLANGNVIRRAVQHLYPLELDNFKDK